MSSHSTRSRSATAEKIRRATELIREMGPEATAYDIREAAKSKSIFLTSGLLCKLRNSVFPDRAKHSPGLVDDYSPSVMLTNGSTIENLRPDCPECGSGNTRIKSYFYHPDGQVTRYRICNDCPRKFTTKDPAGTVQRRAHPRRVMALLATEKKCCTCQKILPVEAFGKKACDPHLYRSSCKTCLNEKRADHYFRTRGRVRLPNGHPGAKEKRERVPCISPNEYSALEMAQGSRCAICGTGNKGTRIRYWCVDHCHSTKKIRGLLCNKCNLGLGNFSDSPERLIAAASYLQSHRMQSTERR